MLEILFAKRYFFISTFWFSSISTFPRCKIFYSLACCFQQLNFLFPTLWHALSISRSTTYTNTRSLTHSVLRFFVKLSEKIVTGKQNETALIFYLAPLTKLLLQRRFSCFRMLLLNVISIILHSEDDKSENLYRRTKSSDGQIYSKIC